MELQQALEQRYSCRAYTNEAPTREQVDAVLEAARLAPTACNYQSQRVYVVTGEKNLAKMDTCTRCRFGAPVCFVIGYDTTVAAAHDPARLGGSAFSFGEHDCNSALVQMMLKATDLGLATCWVGAINDALLRETFSIPEHVAIRSLLVMGVPDQAKGGPSPMHTNRKPVEAIATWI